MVVQILVPTHPDPGGVHSLGNANQPASDEPRKRMGRCSQPTVFQPEEEKVGSECDPSFLHCCVSCMLFDFSPLAEFFTKENFYDKSGEKLFERGDRSCARISPSWFGFLSWYIYICLPRLFWEGLGWVCAKDLVLRGSSDKMGTIFVFFHSLGCGQRVSYFAHFFHFSLRKKGKVFNRRGNNSTELP